MPMQTCAVDDATEKLIRTIKVKRGDSTGGQMVLG